MRVPLLTLVLTTVASASAPGYNITSLFGPYVSPGTLIADSSAPNFQDVLASRWSTWKAPGFTYAIKPVTEADVQSIVKIATKNGIPFLATTAGHGTASGYAKYQNALNINLENFKSVSIDTENNRLTAGGGTIFGDVTTALYEAGKELQTGNTDCVGLVGATIGGGIGVMQGLHGVSLDSLLSVRIVTASGAVTIASKTQNSELFWAIRGAGAKFGIITEAVYEIHDQTNQGNVVMANFVFPASANRSVWQALQSFDAYIPKELALFSSVGWNSTTNQATLLPAIVYFGSWEDAQPYIEKYTSLGPISTTFANRTVPEMYKIFSRSICEAGHYINDFTIGLGQTNVDTYESVFGDLVSFFNKYPSYSGTFVAQRYGNEVVLETPENATAYPWRNIKTQALLNNIYPNASLDSAVLDLGNKIRHKFDATSGFTTREVYLNYAYGDEGSAAQYGARKLPKLLALKAKWDPRNVFGWANPL